MDPDMLGDEFTERKPEHIYQDSEPYPEQLRGQYLITSPRLLNLPMIPALAQMREMLEGFGKSMKNPAPGDVEIPPAIGHMFHICATCHRWYWTRDRYRGHWLLVHWHKLGMD